MAFGGKAPADRMDCMMSAGLWPGFVGRVKWITRWGRQKQGQRQSLIRVQPSDIQREDAGGSDGLHDVGWALVWLRRRGAVDYKMGRQTQGRLLMRTQRGDIQREGDGGSNGLHDVGGALAWLCRQGVVDYKMGEAGAEAGAVADTDTAE